MTDDRLDQCEQVAKGWHERDASRVFATVDAAAAAGFVVELCAEVRRLRRELDDAVEALSNCCDIASPIVRRYLEDVVQP